MWDKQSPESFGDSSVQKLHGKKQKLRSRAKSLALAISLTGKLSRQSSLKKPIQTFPSYKDNLLTAITVSNNSKRQSSFVIPSTINNPVYTDTLQHFEPKPRNGTRTQKGDIIVVQNTCKDPNTTHGLYFSLEEIDQTVLPGISESLPSHAVSGLTARRFSACSYSRPDSAMRSSAFVSQMPIHGLQAEKLDWVYPAKDHVPRKHKANISIWSDLTVHNIERLNEARSAGAIKRVLSEIFTLPNYRDNLKIGIVMDLYFNTIRFARHLAFSPEKTSTFFSIVKKVFEAFIETPFDNFDHTFAYFKELVLTHSVNRPPWSIEIFRPQDAKKITEYVINTLFRHYKMYKYALTPLVRLDLTISYDNMPPSPPRSDPKISESQVEEDNLDEIQEDEDRLAAKEELKEIVKGILLVESKKIEGSVDTQVRTVVETLHAKIDGLTRNPSPARSMERPPSSKKV